MENSKIVYGSTSDFLKYLTYRTKEKEKNKPKKYNGRAPKYDFQEPVETNLQSFE